MFIFSILFRATVLVIAGYFVWFAAMRSEERLKTFGKYLAMWTFVIAVLYVIGSITAPYMGMGRGRMMGRMGGPAAMWMRPGFGGGFAGRFGGGFGGRMMMARHADMRGFMFHRNHPPGAQNGQTQPGTQATQPAPSTQPAPAPSK